MFVRMYACMYVCMYACIYVCMFVCLCVCMYVCMYVCMFVCLYVCMLVCLYACMYVFIYVCMYVCRSVGRSVVALFVMIGQKAGHKIFIFVAGHVQKFFFAHAFWSLRRCSFALLSVVAWKPFFLHWPGPPVEQFRGDLINSGAGCDPLTRLLAPRMLKALLTSTGRRSSLERADGKVSSGAIDTHPGHLHHLASIKGHVVDSLTHGLGQTANNTNLKQRPQLSASKPKPDKP